MLLERSGVDVALAGCSFEGGDVMSRAGVRTVIEKLLTDETLRIRSALDRIETVAEPRSRGVELTGDEIDLFCLRDARLWFLGDRARAEWQQGGPVRDVRFALSGRRLDRARSGESSSRVAAT